MQVVSLSVAQLVTRLNGSQNDLENARRRVADLMDSFKIRLGLPTDVQMAINADLLRPFQLIDARIVDIENDLKNLARNQGPGLIPEPDHAIENAEQSPQPAFQVLKNYVARLKSLKERVKQDGVENVRQDFVPVRDLLKSTNAEQSQASKGDRYFSSATERDRVIADVGRDSRLVSHQRTRF